MRISCAAKKLVSLFVCMCVFGIRAGGVQKPLLEQGAVVLAR